MAILDTGLRNAYDPGRVLVGTGLRGEPVVEQPLLGPLLVLLGIDRGRVVADQHHLDALQTHDAIGLRPAPVVADRHAEDAAKGTPDVEAEITRLEVALLQMLEGALRIELRMARQMNLAVGPDNSGGLVRANTGMEMVPVRGHVGIAKANCNRAWG